MKPSSYTNFVAPHIEDPYLTTSLCYLLVHRQSLFRLKVEIQTFLSVPFVSFDYQTKVYTLPAMGTFHEKQLDVANTSTEGNRTLKDDTWTLSNGRILSQHPSSILLESIPTPNHRWHDGTMTPGTAVASGPGTANNTAKTSRRTSFAGSMRSYTSYSLIEDMKHEVMVNHLFQQQCAKMWIGDVSGEIEGIIIKKRKGNYLACPPALTQSSLAYYCSIMNVQVASHAK